MANIGCARFSVHLSGIDYVFAVVSVAVAGSHCPVQLMNAGFCGCIGIEDASFE